MSVRSICALAAVATIATLLPLAAHAGPESPIGGRMAKQHARIKAGVENGTLTHKEAKHLMARDAKVHAKAEELRTANGTGHLTPGQRAKLNTRMNHISTAIKTKKTS